MLAFPVRKRRLLRRPAVTSMPVGRPVMPGLMTVPEVAARLRCTPQHVFALISRGALASVKVGRKRVISEGQLLAFIERNTVEAAS